MRVADQRAAERLLGGREPGGDGTGKPLCHGRPGGREEALVSEGGQALVEPAVALERGEVVPLLVDPRPAAHQGGHGQDTFVERDDAGLVGLDTALRLGAADTDSVNHPALGAQRHPQPVVPLVPSVDDDAGQHHSHVAGVQAVPDPHLAVRGFRCLEDQCAIGVPVGGGGADPLEVGACV